MSLLLAMFIGVLIIKDWAINTEKKTNSESRFFCTDLPRSLMNPCLAPFPKKFRYGDFSFMSSDQYVKGCCYVSKPSEGNH